MQATKTESPNTLVWIGRLPTVDDQGKPNGETVAIALSNIRDQLFPMKVGDRIGRLTRAEAVRFARNILDTVCAMDAADVAKEAAAKVV
jgi:hypothetical protein